MRTQKRNPNALLIAALAAALGWAALPAFAAETWKSVPLVDTQCASRVKSDPDAHTTKCALQCVKNGFGIYAADGTWLKLDGGEQAGGGGRQVDEEGRPPARHRDRRAPGRHHQGRDAHPRRAGVLKDGARRHAVAGAHFIPSCQARNAISSDWSSTIFPRGRPPACPALVS